MTTENTSLPHILIVDDEEEIRNVLNKIIGGMFFVKTAASGAEALQLIDDQTQIVLADQRMPEMTGSDLFKIIRREHPQIVRILMTGYSDFSAVVDSINEGEVFRYIKKPWDNDELLFTLQEGLQKYKLNQSYIKLIEFNKQLLERNEKIAERLNQTLEELYKARTELDKEGEE